MDNIDRRVLDLEARWYRHGGRKVTAIHDELDLSPTRYAQILNRLLDDPAAELAQPVLIHRLRRLRADRIRQRTARRAS